MPTPDPIRQLEFDAAVREVVARADRPADINRLVAAAVRLRDAFTALHADQAPASGRWPLHGTGLVEGVSLTWPAPGDTSGEHVTVWLDLRHDGPLFGDKAGLTVDGAAQLADALAAAVRAARSVEL